MKLVQGVNSGGAEDATLKVMRSCKDSEREALLKFKQGFLDDYGVLSSWGSEEECCKWRGIQCSKRTGFVIVLDLHGRYEYFTGWVYLSAKVSPSSFELKHLKYFDLSWNNFQWRPIPEFIGSLSRLQYPNLANAHFASTIPRQLGNLTNLLSLDLGFNYNLAVKNLEWLFHLRLLQYLDLSLVDLEKTNWLQQKYKLSFLTELRLIDLSLSCELEGELPKSFKNLIHFKSLDLSMNNLSGQLSDLFWTLAANEKSPLEILKLDAIKFSGSLPDITRFLSLRGISIRNYRLNGSFPKSFGQISTLVYLDFSYNQMTGSFPDQILFPSLKILDLSFNSVALKFSSSQAPFQLDIIRLAYCNLGARFPKWIQSKSNFSELDISSAKISNTIPNWFWDFSPKLQHLNISYNQIHGAIPDLSLNHAQVLDLSQNNISGSIPLYFNNLISLVQEITSLEGLVSLNLSRNNLTGNIIQKIDHTKMLESLDLSRNQLPGEIPTGLASLTLLSVLDLSNNNFLGKIPSSTQL
ncbi:hypothetical protein LguiA_022313 [Lonicera macranthoides]